MKKIITVLFILTGFLSYSQSHQAFQAGEWFRFRVHYLGFNASYATLEVEETTLNQKPVFHVTGKGKSTGLLHLFFKVDDNYESYFDKKSGRPYRFIRQIDEGGHVRDLRTDFNYNNNTALVHNRKYDTWKTYPVEAEVHDMLSSFYYLRNNLDLDNIKEGEVMQLSMFIDDENFDFRLRFLGREVINTKFGKMAALKFRPAVMAGRVFKEQESLTLWVSDDGNRMPLRIKADLAVGSLKADIDGFKGLKHPMKIIMK